MLNPKDGLFWLFQKYRNARIMLQGNRSTAARIGGILQGVDVTDVKAVGERLRKTYHLKTVGDGDFIDVVRKLQVDLLLRTFVETGTYEGDTSLLMSHFFESVYTCDIEDHNKPIEFMLRRNLRFAVADSRRFLESIKTHVSDRTFFFLDAHWYDDVPIREELAWVFANSHRPVVAIDDFDTKLGVDVYSFQGQNLDMDLIAPLVPQDYKFFFSGRSYRNRGIVFLVPPDAPYGCPVGIRDCYGHAKDSLWP
ncbi:MAG: hypothetical protein WCC69_00690 [Pirellulales bacterium]